MFHPTLKHFAILVFAAVGCCFAPVQRAGAGDWVPVSPAEVADAECEPCQPCFGECLCRKLKLHCIYARRACRCRYIALPYTEPTSVIYYAPGMSGGTGYNPSYPPGGGSYGYGSAGGYGYGDAGYAPQPYAGHPAFAPPGTVFIR